jgi:hypothetical protein
MKYLEELGHTCLSPVLFEEHLHAELSTFAAHPPEVKLRTEGQFVVGPEDVTKFK